MTDKIIWSYWDDANDIPYLVKLSVQSWKKSNHEYIIHFMNKTNFTEFVNVSELPPIFNSTTHLQEKADIIRLYVLYKYGGIWVDSSIFITQSLAPIWNNKYDVGGFFIPLFTNNQNKKVFENWFISAPKQSKLILAWKNEFFRALTDYKNRKEYISDIENNGIDLQNINGKEYLMMHCCYLKIINDANYNIKQFSSTDNNGPLQWLCDNNWNILYSSKKLCLYTNCEVPAILKFRGCDRPLITKAIHFYAYSSRSIIGRLINF
jgi:hypothetical protein